MNLLDVEEWRWGPNPAEHRRTSFRIDVGEQIAFCRISRGFVSKFISALYDCNFAEAKRFQVHLNKSDSILIQEQGLQFNADLRLDESLALIAKVQGLSQQHEFLSEVFGNLQLLGFSAVKRSDKLANLSDADKFAVQVATCSALEPLFWLVDLGLLEAAQVSNQAGFWYATLRNRAIASKTTILFIGEDHLEHFQEVARIVDVTAGKKLYEA